MKSVQKGFTLIELMIVIAIIGILAAIAMPAYQNYIVRAQVTEDLSRASCIKTNIEEYYNSTGDWPTNITAMANQGVSTPIGKYVSGVTVSNGTIVATYGGSSSSYITGKTLAIQPYLDANHDIIWVCGNAPDPSGTGVTDADGGGNASAAAGTNTSVLNTYLPSSCRPKP